ncbi:MAG: hypothetical protein ABWX85_03580 [Arthrobacter sp.]
MNHKLRVLVRVDVEPGCVTLEVTGCLTQADFPALLHIMRRAGRLGAGTDVMIDLHGASHLDPEILLQLRSVADASAVALESGAGSPAGAEPYRVILAEPADLPICMLHVGSDGEVLAGLDGELAAAVPLDIVPADGAGGAPGLLAPLVDASSPVPDEFSTINGLQLSEYFEGTLDPVSTVQALSDVALGQLADALYQHLDTNSPSFGAHTWYELAAEELQTRHLGEADGPAEGELAAGQNLA